ncbi:MAG: DUF2177 family protein [Gemmatimonadota bacterium]|nr:DUF2177 family protein [Gemmatimonadota bacterium]
MTHRLQRTTFLPGGLSDVFAFFKNPRNLERITPPWLGFRITAATDEAVRDGTRIAYRLSLHGIPLRWESRIAEYAEDSHFADEQMRGPYARWYHRHTFRAVPGGVEMTDDVEYRLPFGPLGRLVHWLVVVAKGFYAREMGDLLRPRMQWGPALLFYAVYVAAVVTFVVLPAIERASLARAIAMGAFFGFAAYAAYDLTSLALIRGFTMRVAAVDLAWGAVVTATASASGYLVGR